MNVGSYFLCVANSPANIEGLAEVGWELKGSGKGLKSLCRMGMGQGRKLRIYRLLNELQGPAETGRPKFVCKMHYLNENAIFKYNYWIFYPTTRQPGGKAGERRELGSLCFMRGGGSGEILEKALSVLDFSFPFLSFLS